jgi:DNA recombination protein RmuC
MIPPEIIYSLLGFLIVLVLCFVLLQSKRRSLESELTNERDEKQEFVKTIQSEREKNAALESDRRRIGTLDAEIVRLNEKMQILEGDRGRLSAIANEVENLRSIRDAADKELRKLNAENAELREQKKAMETWYEKAKSDFTGMFATLSQNALKENRGSFLDLVTPFQTRLREFEQKVDAAYRTEAAERNSLQGEIKKLVELNHQISKEASNLAMALKGDTKKQGNWGELILEKVLEFSGLRKGEEYKLQVSQQDEDGRRQQPDAIIYLPEHKHIIVDAKVSLVAYDRYVSAQTEEERSLALLEHITSVKNHIKLLSDKKYQSLPDLDSPDFTLLFMPIESSFGLAIQADNELFAYAWDRKIVIVSPSTLLATLRTISSIWKQERQTKNALEIADRAGKMYDKFVGFVEDMISVGKRMDDAKTSYSGAMNKLSTGAGNLVRQSEQLKEMGAKATKQLPPTLLDRAGELPLAE